MKNTKKKKPVGKPQAAAPKPAVKNTPEKTITEKTKPAPPAAVVEKAAAAAPAEQPKKRRRRVRIHEVTAANDIRYRGPLNYLHLQILGWMCIVATAAALLVSIGMRLDKNLAAQLGTLQKVLKTIGEFSLPFLLIANFARILDDSEGYKGQMLKNIGAAAGFAILFYIFFYRYLAGTVAALISEPEKAGQVLEIQVMAGTSNGFIAFNIFIDLLLCTLVMFFLNYRPRHLFLGKWVYLFRVFALLPIGYEVFCMYLKIQAARGIEPIPVWMYPLLPVKPAMTFVLFIFLALFVKTRELRFRRHGKTHEDYKAFLQTNRNSLNFSVFLAVMMVLIAAVDLAMTVLFSYAFGSEHLQNQRAMKAALGLETAQVETVQTEAPQDETIRATTAPAETAQATAAPAETAQADPGGKETAAPAGTTTPAETAPGDSAAAPDESQLTEEEINALDRGFKATTAIGFGGAVDMAFLAPFMLLFSYTRKPKNKKVGMMVPVAGIVLILVIMLEFFRYAMFHLPFKKIDLNVIREYVRMFTELIQQ